MKNLRGKFGNPQNDDTDDQGKAPFDVPILGEGWDAYYQKVKNEKPTAWGHSMNQRLKVIETARQLFADHEHFNQIDRDGRRKIGGLMVEDGVDYRFFGSMVGSGMFKKAINNNDENLSVALDLIPAAGSISREMYLNYIEAYKKAFPKGRHGIATATRLLAMKRPDTFVCFDKLNR